MPFQKISILPHRRDWNFLGGGEFCKAKTFKEMYEASLKSPERWGGGVWEKKIPSVGEVWIFSGITQYAKMSGLKVHVGFALC